MEQQIATSLSLTFESSDETQVIFRKTTGGKIIVTWASVGFSVYGLVFISENKWDSLYWAAQWAAYCR